MTKAQLAQIALSLHITSAPISSPMFRKMAPRVVQETTVRGRRALWAVGPYLVQRRAGDFDAVYLVTGQTLIWTQVQGDGRTLTYRLETNLPLDEAVSVAESLQPALP